MTADPYNIIITGVGGQGNVLASRVLGNMLVKRGYEVTIGETFGATQRGGSVMSHLRIAKEGVWSPQIPRGRAHVIVALEPAEAVRVLKDYGNENVEILSNTRPVYPVSVIAGDVVYPPVDEIRSRVQALLPGACFIDATEEALKMGQPILSNIIMLGALSGFTPLPIRRSDFKSVVSRFVPEDALDLNLRAFDTGRELLKKGKPKSTKRKSHGGNI
jgi:indolepyruvate ferredoxin oxidoreductase beta subunit